MTEQEARQRIDECEKQIVASYGELWRAAKNVGKEAAGVGLRLFAIFLQCLALIGIFIGGVALMFVGGGFIGFLIVALSALPTWLVVTGLRDGIFRGEWKKMQKEFDDKIKELDASLDKFPSV